MAPSQKLYSENREEKLELLKGLTLGQDDAGSLCPLSQVHVIIEQNVMLYIVSEYHLCT